MNTFCYTERTKKLGEAISKTERQTPTRRRLASLHAGRPRALAGLPCSWRVGVRALALVWGVACMGQMPSDSLSPESLPGQYGSVDNRAQLNQEPGKSCPLPPKERIDWSTVALAIVFQMLPATDYQTPKTSRPAPDQKPALEKCLERGDVGRRFTGHQADRKDASLPASLVTLDLVRDREHICQDTANSCTT